MTKRQYTILVIFSLIVITGCGGPTSVDFQPADASGNVGASEPDDDGFVWQTEQFADLKIVRYQIPGWEQLSQRQQALVYCLNMAGLSGRDIMYDQNNRYNLRVRNLLENIYTSYKGDKGTKGWGKFEVYLKRIWFSNGIHHHYSNKKHQPEFSKEYFNHLLSETSLVCSDDLMEVIFNPEIESKKVEQDGTLGLVESSAVNFYGPKVTTEEAKAYFASIKIEGDRSPVEYGLNSRLIKTESGEIVEEVYKIGGLYNDAIEEIVKWLNEAQNYTENEKQSIALAHLIDYYETGDLEKWSLYNINWVQDTEGDVDYINGFIEVYNDPLGYTGSYETVVEIKDFEASARMQTLMENAQWFEDHMPFMEEHKKEEVVGITYNVVNVAGEAGDASPSTPIGVNLPNSNWIRQLHGSKSVSLGNIVSAYDKASGGGMLSEFAHDEVEIKRVKAHGTLAGKLHTAMHEVIGHASGKLEEDVDTPKETIKEYSSTLEEGRADLVALYFLLDEKLVELGLMKTIEVGRAEYDSYIRNGMMTQVVRLELGDDIEEAHMRNRAWVSNWCYEKGLSKGIIRKYVREGKTYVDITDYEALRGLFGELLREVQRIKSQGDYEAAKNLVEGYGVKVDQVIHKEVLERSEALDIAPYGGFINPQMESTRAESGEIISVDVTFPDNFTEQMLYYSSQFSFLPEVNSIH
ncbi:MAG: dihydrofolate reductase [Crocinitomicaceae bacterium]|mgnify:CR=1 FL=1|nr:dihydrofolate reductase [Crocinitomicaceae bacterium]|tara:strand:- start:1226 stop:3301 length:2076 start_codon:yes stop_codon:yes gene_type:complete